MKDKMTLSAAILADVGSEFRPQSNRPGAALLVFEAVKKAGCPTFRCLVPGYWCSLLSRFLITDR